MLYPTLIDPKFDEARPTAGERDVPVPRVKAAQAVSTANGSFTLALSVIVNTVVGAAWLGALLLAPLWLDRIIALL